MSAGAFELTGNVVDILHRRVFPGRLSIVKGKIASVRELPEAEDTFLLPGFVDAHVHIESSMLVPAEFARAAVVHGTVATVSDPHEIGNVLGVAGVHYMLTNAQGVPFKFYFGAPSCVPATTFETAGASIGVEDVKTLLDDPRISYLSEMMNFPGVLNADPEVTAKLQAAQRRSKPIDGHAPGLRGEEARRYFAAGMTTDHESFLLDEARDKLNCGAKIAIREGSAARNFEALFPLIDEAPQHCMLCSDDKHPDELLAGHIDRLVARAVAQGADVMNALRCGCVTPVLHYGLDVGLLRPGDDADLIEVEDLTDFRALRTWVRGQLVAERGQTRIPRSQPQTVNKFADIRKSVDEFRVRAESDRIHVIEAVDGQLVTHCRVRDALIRDELAVSDPKRDVLKMTVVNRYHSAPPAVAFVENFGLKSGAIASSVAHDSHNVIAVGVDDEDLCAAVNLVLEAQGGLSVAAEKVQEVLPLPVAGLMSTQSCDQVGRLYAELDRQVKALGSPLRAPFMTLSFMALLVIPEIKLSDLGLFDGNRFEFLPLFIKG